MAQPARLVSASAGAATPYEVTEDSTNDYAQNARNDLNRICTHLNPPLKIPDLPSMGTTYSMKLIHDAQGRSASNGRRELQFHFRFNRDLLLISHQIGNVSSILETTLRAIRARVRPLIQTVNARFSCRSAKFLEAL